MLLYQVTIPHRSAFAKQLSSSEWQPMGCCFRRTPRRLNIAMAYSRRSGNGWLEPAPNEQRIVNAMNRLAQVIIGRSISITLFSDMADPAEARYGGGSLLLN